MAKQNKPPFAALPLAALADKRLKRDDLAVLGAIAFRDRFSLHDEKPGLGCFATNADLGEIAGVGVTVVSRSISNLTTCGHIIIQRGRSGPKARKMIRVIYSENPQLNSCAANQQDSCSANQPANANSCPANQDALLNSRSNSQPYDLYDEIIPQENLSFKENLLIDSAEATRSKNSLASAGEDLNACWEVLYPYERTSAQLSIIDREIRSDPSRLTKNICDALESVSIEAEDNRLRGHAQRILDWIAQIDEVEEGLGSGHDEAPPAPLSEQDTKFLTRIKTTWDDVSDDPDRRTLLAQRSGFSPSVIAAVAHGHTRLTSNDIRKLRDACVSI